MALTKVTSSGLTDNSITTDKIKDGTIVNADISSSAAIQQSKVSGLSTLTQPTISSFTPTTIDDDAGGNITITGTNFVSIPSVEIINTSTGAITTASSVTFTSSTSLTAAIPSGGGSGTYKVRVENPGGLAVQSSSTLLYSSTPTFSTAAGSLGTFDAGSSISVDIDATGDDSSAVTFAVQSGSLPGGLSLNTSTGAITGTESGATATTIYNFTIRATDSESQTTDRAFSITIEVGITEGGGLN